MKRFRLLCLTALLMAFGMAWGEDVIWTYDPAEGLITDASQMYANSVQSEQFGVHNLIDPCDDYTNIIFHNSWSDPLPMGTYNYLQVHLNEARQDCIFMMIGSNWVSTYDTPDEMEIFVSNDPDDDNAWVSICELPDMIPAELHGEHPAFYTSPRIDFGGDYTDVRFVVKATVNNRKSNSGNIFFSLARFQMYPPIKIDDPVEVLRLTLEDIEESGIDFPTGTDPGYHDPGLAAAYEKALKDAYTAVSKGDADACREAKANLEAAMEAVKNAINPVTDGFYYLVNADPRFLNEQGVEKGMYVADAMAKWKTFDEDDECFVFYIEKKNNDTYVIRNFQTGEYLSEQPSGQTTVATTTSPGVGQLLTASGAGRWIVANLNNNKSYHAAGHSLGLGESGNVTQWQNAALEFCTWYLRRIDDQGYIDDLIKRQEQVALCNAIAELSRTGREVWNSAFTYEINTENPLITEVYDGEEMYNGQIWTNAQSPLEGSLPALIDGDPTTYFHSLYNEAEYVGPHNLTIDLRGNRVSQFIFHMKSRMSSYYDFPSDIRIYASNNIANDDDWTEVAHITEGVPTGSGVDYDSPGIVMNDTYRYLRFDVLKTISGRSNSVTGTYFFTLGEFQIYEYDIDYENSLCYTVEGLEEACNTLIDLIDEAQFKIEDQSVTQQDVDELEAAIAAVRELIEGKPMIKFSYTKDTDGNYWYFNPADGLLTSEDQLYANSEQSTVFRVGRLIDKSDSYGTIIFHTSWDKPLPADVENYLTFHFNEPHDAFAFTMVGSSWGGTYDTPDDVVFWGTNTPDDESSWKQLLELPDMIPDDQHETYPAFYTSPRIKLDAEYTDLKMVVKSTVNNRNNGNGNIYVSLARMQFFDPRQVTDEHVIDSLRYAEVAGMLEPLMDSVRIYRNKAFGVGTVPLITRDDQLYCPSEESEQFYVGRLIDPSQDYSSIIFHSSWTNPLHSSEDNYLQVHLDEAVEHFVFSMIGSNWAATYDTPDDVIIKATNTPDDEYSWVDIVELPDMIPADQHGVHPAKYTSPVIELGAKYTDIRFQVLKTVNMRLGSYGVPYLSLARFQVWGDAADGESPYSTVSGLAEAVDEMLALAEKTQAAPSAENMAKLREAVKLVRWTMINGNLEPGKEPVNMLFIGCSITYGAGISDRGADSAPSKCAAKVAEDTGRPVFFQNCGVSGSTTEDWLPKTARFRNASRSAGDLTENGGYLFFSIMLGTNDSAETGPTGSPISPENYGKNLKAIVHKLHETYPEARFIINYPIWYSPNTHNGATYLQPGLDRLQSYYPIIAQIVPEMQAEGIEVWDGDNGTFAFFEGREDLFFPENGYDGIFYLHPNPAGAEYLGNFWAEAIMKHLDGGNVEPDLVESICIEGADKPVYNLQGQRLGTDAKHLAPGIYIIGSQKVAIMK